MGMLVVHAQIHVYMLFENIYIYIYMGVHIFSD